MPQFDFGVIDPAVKDGEALAADLNAWRTALHSTHSGSGRPVYAVANMLWVKTATGPNENQLYYFDGTDDILIGTFNTSTNTFTANVVATQNEQTDLFTTTSASMYQLVNVASVDIDELDVRLGGVGQAAIKDFTYNPTLKQVTFVSPPPIGISLCVRGRG